MSTETLYETIDELTSTGVDPDVRKALLLIVEYLIEEQQTREDL